MSAELSPPPREPEIEALGRIARRAIRTIRTVLWLGGAVAVGFGLYQALGQPAAAVSARGFVWTCVGLPLLAPVPWLFGRGRWPALAAGALLWFGPSLLPDDPEYGFVLRFFASLVACLTLLVWRTLATLGASDPSPR